MEQGLGIGKGGKLQVQWIEEGTQAAVPPLKVAKFKDKTLYCRTACSPRTQVYCYANHLVSFLSISCSKLEEGEFELLSRDKLKRMARQPHSCILFPLSFCNFYYTRGIWTEPAHATLHSWTWFLNMRPSAEQGIMRRKNLPIDAQIGTGEFLNKKAYRYLCQYYSGFWQLFSQKV